MTTIKTGNENNKLSRRAFMAASALAVPAAASALASPPSTNATAISAPQILKGVRRRNVLFISTDDMANRLGCYGVPVIKSPNLDRLAQRGVRFDHHYCQFPLCGPSRSSLMTGLAPDTLRVWDLNTDFRDAFPDVVTLPQLFQKNGYFTGRAGKIYHYNNPSEIGTPGFDDTASWHKTSNPAGYDRTHDEGLVKYFAAPEKVMEGFFGAGGSRRAQAYGGLLIQPRGNPSKVPWLHGGTGPSGIRIAQDGCTPTLPLSKNGDLGIAMAGHPSDGDEKTITDFLVAEAAISMMEEHKDGPWFLGAGFYRPHLPFIVPSKYYDMYSADEMQVPHCDASELKTAPAIAYTSTNPNFGMTDQEHREALRGYYAAISFVDAQVGRLLAALDRLDLTENTTIVFWADHGFMVGEHGQWQKMMLFEASARVPFMISGAGVSAPGKACKRTSEHLNIFPTLAEMCGLNNYGPNLQGHSLVPLLQSPDAPWDHPSISQVSRRSGASSVMGYSIRTERFRYTMWADGAEGEELYDYDQDPRELINLANTASFSTTKAELRSRLLEISRARGKS